MSNSDTFIDEVTEELRRDQMMAKLKANDKAHVAFCVSGILGCLVCYGVLQVRG